MEQYNKKIWEIAKDKELKIMVFTDHSIIKDNGDFGYNYVNISINDYWFSKETTYFDVIEMLMIDNYFRMINDGNSKQILDDEHSDFTILMCQINYDEVIHNVKSIFDISPSENNETFQIVFKGLKNKFNKYWPYYTITEEKYLCSNSIEHMKESKYKDFIITDFFIHS